MIVYLIVAAVGLFAISKLQQSKSTTAPKTTQTTMPVDHTPAPNRTDISSSNENLASSYLMYKRLGIKWAGEDPTKKTSGGSTGTTAGSGGSFSPPSGGGGAGGGGSLTCPIEGTEIVAVGVSQPKIEKVFETNWVRIKTKNGKELVASHSHLLYTRYGLQRIRMLTIGEAVVTIDGESEITDITTETKRAYKLAIEIPIGHLYWANGILSHNVKKIL